MLLPTTYELERAQLLTMLAYNLFDGTEDSIAWILGDIAQFAELYPDAMAETEKCYTIKDHKPSSEVIDGLAIVSIGMYGLHLKLTKGDDMMFGLATGLISDMDISKEFSQKVRNAVVAEIAARAV